MKRLCLAALFVALLAAFVLPASAQPVISAKSGLLSYVEGQVSLNDQPVEFSSTRFADVKENSIVKTGDGRAEVLLTPGVTLRMGENSSLRMIANRLVDTRVELLAGSAVVEADMIAKDTNVTVVVGKGSVELPKAGLYRFNAEPAQIKVFKGAADVELAGQTTPVSGSRLLSLATDTVAIEKFDVDDTDSLDRWSHQRGSYLAMANMSAARSLVSSGSGFSTWGMAGGMCAPPLGGYNSSYYGNRAFNSFNGNGYNGYGGLWNYNSYYGMVTFIPCTGSLWSPYGYQFWSPSAIGGRTWVKPPVVYSGGSSRANPSPSGSAWLARPTTLAGYRGTTSAAAAPAIASRAGSNSAVTGGGNGSNTGASGARSSGGFSGGSRAGSSGGGGGGAHGGGSSGGHGR